MPSPPAFQFYADDFLAGTIDMTAEEVGAYMRLLCLQWTKGAITDRQKLSVGVSKEVAETVLSLKFVKQKDGTFVNVRLEEVRNLRENYAKQKSDAGKKGAESRWHSHTSANGKRIAEGMAEGMANDSSSVSSLHIKKELDKKEKQPTFKIPTVEQVAEYAKCYSEEKSKPLVDAETFHDHYTQNGWLAGKVKMKDWKAAVRLWSRRHGEFGTKKDEGSKYSSRAGTLAEVRQYCDEHPELGY